MNSLEKNKQFALHLSKGFTLIELLVVVAIIGILASVVLASLNGARSKGRDKAIMSELSSMRAQSELYYSVNGNYGVNYVGALAGSGGVEITPNPTCANMSGQLTSASTNMFGTSVANMGLGDLIKGTCQAGATAIFAAVNNSNAVPATIWALKATGVSANTFFCVDSSGNFKSYASAPTISAVPACP